jgi:hypothetical protein
VPNWRRGVGAEDVAEAPDGRDLLLQQQPFFFDALILKRVLEGSLTCLDGTPLSHSQDHLQIGILKSVKVLVPHCPDVPEEGAAKDLPWCLEIEGM